VKRRKRTFKQERAKGTHDAILQAAAKVFPRKGFEKTQTPDIARAAGISTGAVYRYFRNKREIYLEMLEGHLDAARAEVATRLAPARFIGTDPRAAIPQILDVLFDQVKKNPALARVYLAMSLTDPDVQRLRARSEAEDRAVVASLLEVGIPRERVPDPAAAALVLQQAVVGAAIDCALGSRTVDERSAKAALESAISRYLFAVG